MYGRLYCFPESLLIERSLRPFLNSLSESVFNMYPGRPSSLLVLLLCSFIVLVASARSVREQLAQADQAACEYYPGASELDDLIPPLLITFPAMILDVTPEIFLGFFGSYQLVIDVNPASV